ncbi:hypothetical protein AKO1_008132 [Acrasis kona]|uniref:Uncharacterized protein n=1 Tax=Acrasis kona TaxID=1008807 RepID=A0AAW2YML1_9EUKA
MPFMSHTNFKILVFLSIVFYTYIKMSRLSTTNHIKFRIIDDMWFLIITGIKNYYHNQGKNGLRSDQRNLLSLFGFVIFNHLSGGSSVKTLQEDFYFSASGNVLLAYFFM